MNTSKRIEIEWHCKQLALDFAWCIDNFEFERLAALFSPEGIFDRAGQVLRGRKAIAEAIAAGRPRELLTRHVTCAVHFQSVDEATAEAVVYNMSYHGLGDPAKGPVIYQSPQGRLLDIRDHYELFPEGWRIASRVAVPIMEPEGWPHLSFSQPAPEKK